MRRSGEGDAEGAEELSKKKQFASLRFAPSEQGDLPVAITDYDNIRPPFRQKVQLKGAQIFLRNLLDPHTKYKRMLINHAPGTGKTMILNTIARVYIDHFKLMKEPVQITIIGFTEDIVMRELMTYPEFGYVSAAEVEELIRLGRSTNDKDRSLRATKIAVIKRRITNPSKGGYYRFYGYQKFANDILTITSKGEAAGVTHSSLYENEEGFEAGLKKHVEAEEVELNMGLIYSMRNGVVMCDEIHNTYNTKAKNNRGIAIKYVLDLLEREDPRTAPRALFATATPLTGSPSEIIDVMNLLIPLGDFKRNDFFSGEDLRDGALEKISRICSGYVSFLGDTQSEAYPSRVFDGDELEGVPYLKFIKCPLSKMHEAVMDEAKEAGIGAHALSDIVFPHPDCSVHDIESSLCKKGLYISSEVRGTIEAAPVQWKSKIGIHTTLDGVTGSFLHSSALGRYSSKYKKFVDDVVSIIKKGIPGKMIVYHYYVVTSGVLLLREILSQNGFIGPYSNPTSSTLCSVCGIEKGSHEKIDDHGYMPCRYLLMYGEEKKEMDRGLTLFNGPSNSTGYEYRIVVGSQAIQEGINFKAVRFMFVTHPPRDISSLVQLLGRAVRRGSHDQLPREQRTVNIRIYIGTSRKFETPDASFYRRKMKSYLSIQLIERELRKHAVDCFINYDLMKKEKEASLDGLPFEPAVTVRGKDKELDRGEWKAFGFADEEVRTITKVVKILFLFRPVWKYEDLWEAVKNPSRQFKTPYDHSLFDESNFVISLNFLIGHSSVKYGEITSSSSSVPIIMVADEPRRIVFTPPYFVLVPLDEIGAPIPDVDIFMREAPRGSREIIDVHIEHEDMQPEEFRAIMESIGKSYSPKEIKYAVSETSPSFHIYAMRRIVEGTWGESPVWEGLRASYDSHGILLYIKDLLNKDLGATYGVTDPSKPFGFRNGDVIEVHNKRSGKWVYIPNVVVFRDSRKENHIIVGYVSIKNFEPCFKLRRPTTPDDEGIVDRRKIARGVACSSLLQETKLGYIRALGTSITGKKGDNFLCQMLLRTLVDKELEDRAGSGEIRWFYNIFEEAP